MSLSKREWSEIEEMIEAKVGEVLVKLFDPHEVEGEPDADAGEGTPAVEGEATGEGADNGAQ